MAQNLINVRLVTRHDTAEKWAASTAILEAGEFALDTTNNIVKVGDGVHTWSELSVFNDVETAAHYEGTVGEGETHEQVIARVLTEADAEAKKDDIFIVKTLIS